jgi:hypothetical protein
VTAGVLESVSVVGKPGVYRSCSWRFTGGGRTGRVALMVGHKAAVVTVVPWFAES